MTNIAEEKARRESELKKAPDMIVMMRLKVIEAVELAMEMKSKTDQGLSKSYHDMALFYGRQRSVLRGLSAGDIMHFNLPDASSWNQSPEFTFPSETQFGYDFVDNEGNAATIDDPDLYYLTKKKGADTLSTMEEDSDAFVSPARLLDQQQTVITWGASVFNVTLSQVPQPGSLHITRNGTYAAQDDGAGAISGADISGTIDYQNKTLNFISSDPISPSELVYAIYDTDTDPVIPANHDQVFVTTDSNDYRCTMGKKVVPGTLKVHIDAVEVAVDDDAGTITGPSLNGSIDYNAKTLSLTFANPDDRFKTISLIHDSITNESLFEESYSPVDFALDTKTYLTNHTLNLINIPEGVLAERPKLTTTTLLRRKKDHQVVGTIKIICEGLDINWDWNHLTGEAEETTIVPHNDFKSLLGFLDMDLVNPSNNNDLQNGANPFLSSSGRKVGEDSYPDIEKNPFWPCTDGTYTGSMIDKGHFVHTEEEKHKWSTHNDIKWRYGTRPNGYNPATFATSGGTVQDNPEIVVTALQAINSFSGPDPIAVPPDSGNAINGGTDYKMEGDFVHVYPYVGNSVDGYAIGPGSIFLCYHNSVQHLIDDHLNNLLAQCDVIIALGDVANTVDTEKQTGDTQFYTNTVSFKNALNSFLTYHNGFDPLNRTDYDTSKMDAFKAATEAYLSQFTDRLVELDTIVGDPETADSYSKIIYDACNYAANKDIGYLKDVIDKLSSIQDVYGMITQKQQQYAMYQDISP